MRRFTKGFAGKFHVQESRICHRLVLLPMSIFSNRTLLQALTVSLLIHVVFLVGVVNLFPATLDVPSAPINVMMGRDGRTGPVKPAAESVSPQKPVVVPLHTPLPVTTYAGAWQIPANAQSPVTPPVALETKQAPTPEARADAGSAPAKTDGGGVAGAASATREGVNADDMRYYRMSLATAARRFKRYPPLARERGWEGTADVALNVSSRVMMPEVVLVRSSGRSILDEQALEMVAQAARVTSLPNGLKGRDFRVVLPVQFSLESDQ